MCRYIASLSSANDKSASKILEKEAPDNNNTKLSQPQNNSNNINYSITCTGVDTLSELHDKYKDIEFILRNIRACSDTPTTTNCKTDTSLDDRIQIDTTILHGVNAVDASNCNDNITNKNTINKSYDHVIFNHPHLGTEDAQLHSRFLQHFFFAVTKRWLSTSGVLHLTLVIGQCERWKCIDGAAKHGLVLLKRGVFIPPPPPIKNDAQGKSDGGSKSYYKLRRHQSGRSFAKRRMQQQQYGNQCCHVSNSSNSQNDSETLVFGRACDYPTADTEAAQNFSLLPWESMSKADNDEQDKSNTTSTPTISNQKTSNGSAHPCKYCSKGFDEKRSLKNHVICSHPNADEVKVWNMEKSKKKNRKRKLKDSISQSTSSNGEEEVTGPPWICTLCDEVPQKKVNDQSNELLQPPTRRTFPHKQALLDHQRAKHTGLHLNVKPDWYSGRSDEKISTQEGKNKQPGGDLESCPICDYQYTTELDKIRHEMEFIPLSSEIAQGNNSSSTASTTVYKCSRCSKTFRELRGKLQHENFCTVEA